jgi:hypothetical protein
MKFTQDQKAMFLANVAKTLGLIGFVSVLGYLGYQLTIAEKQGRERAL